MRVLVVEDNALLRHHLKVQLQELGHQVDAAEDAREADYYLGEHLPDIAIADLGLPDEDGLHFLSRMRREKMTQPVLILTAREALSQRVEGLRLGADDYLCKPFALIEVAARLEALIRRAHGQSSSELRHGKVILDPNRLTASLDGESLALKPKEFALLELLMRNAGRVLPRKLIEEKLYT